MLHNPPARHMNRIRWPGFGQEQSAQCIMRTLHISNPRMWHHNQDAKMQAIFGAEYVVLILSVGASD